MIIMIIIFFSLKYSVETLDSQQATGASAKLAIKISDKIEWKNRFIKDAPKM